MSEMEFSLKSVLYLKSVKDVSAMASCPSS